MTVQRRAHTERTNERFLKFMELSRNARSIERIEELDHLIVNTTHRLVPYRQAVLWRDSDMPIALSGLVSLDENAPLIRWLKALHYNVLSGLPAGPVEVQSLSEDDQATWS